MQHCTNSVINTSIGAVPGARVVVTNLDGSAASIFSDNGVTAISGNAVFADAYGNFGFYAANGRYTVTVSGTGIDTMIVLDVLLYDPQDDLEYAAALVGEAAASASAAATSAGAATTANTSAQTAAATASAGAGTASTAATLAQSWASLMGTMVGGIDYSAKYYAQQAAASAAIATAGQVQADWNVTDAGSNAFIKDKPILATVATSGAYADLSGKPTIPTNTNQLTNGSGYITAATAPVTSVNSKAGGSVTLTTDDVQEFGTPTNMWFTAARVRNAILTGLSLASSAAAAATDSVLIAIGKLQAQASANATAISTSGSITRSPRSANTMLAAADRGSLLDATGTFTQTFDTASNLGAGWRAYIRNSGTGNITLTPSGVQQIDGTTGYIMYPNECRLIQCDGATLTSVVIQAFKLSTQVSGAFAKPPGYNYFDVLASAAGSGGAGGSGGGSGSGSGTTGGGGGGGGASGLNGSVTTARFAAARLPATISYAVGSGGTGGTGGNGGAGVSSATGVGIVGTIGTSGTAGGATSFGTVGASYYITTTGGAGSPTSGAPGGQGGTQNAGIGGTVSASTVTSFTASYSGLLAFPVANAANGTAGSTGAANFGAAGGLGGAATASYLWPAVAAGAAGAGSVTPGAVGNSATALPKAAAGQGGAGGSGGAGSCGGGGIGSGNGGNGAKGQDGGDGLIEITGVI